jgi:hypothetical protein
VQPAYAEMNSSLQRHWAVLVDSLEGILVDKHSNQVLDILVHIDILLAEDMSEVVHTVLVDRRVWVDFADTPVVEGMVVVVHT